MFGLDFNLGMLALAKSGA